MCPVIDNKFGHYIFKVVCEFTRIHSYFDNVMTKSMINSARKQNLLRIWRGKAVQSLFLDLIFLEETFLVILSEVLTMRNMHG